MKNAWMLVMLLLLVLAPLSSAGSTITKKTGEPMDISIPCTNTGADCSMSATCELTIFNDVNNSYIVQGAAMTAQGNGMFSYDAPAQQSGTYRGKVTCTEGAISGTDTFDIVVTPTGTSGKSTVFLLIFGISAIVLLVLGILLKNPYMGFISGMVFLTIGVYTMAFGFVDTADLYTRGFSAVLIGLGAFFTIVAAYEWVIDDIFGPGTSD